MYNESEIFLKTNKNIDTYNQETKRIFFQLRSTHVACVHY